MTCCSGASKTATCPKRRSCSRYLEYFGAEVVPVISMPVSVGDNCYMFIPVREVGLPILLPTIPNPTYS